MTKEERAAEALKKRQAEVEEIRQKQDDERRKREEFAKEANKLGDDRGREEFRQVKLLQYFLTLNYCILKSTVASNMYCIEQFQVGYIQ